MRGRILSAAALGALAAALTKAFAPNALWWAVGALMAFAALLYPSRPGRGPRS